MSTAQDSILHIRIPAELLDALRNMADEEGLSLSAAVRRALLLYLRERA